jgi:hypothetical protein
MNDGASIAPSFADNTNPHIRETGRSIAQCCAAAGVATKPWRLPVVSMYLPINLA